MSQEQSALKKTTFGGYDRKSVLNYIYELNAAAEAAQDKLEAQLEEVTASREKLSETIKDLEGKMEGLRGERKAVESELSSEKERTGELSALIDALEEEKRRQAQIIAEKDAEIAQHLRRSEELIEKNRQLEEKKQEVERASAHIGELLLRTRMESEKALADAKKQAEDMVAEAGRSMKGVYDQFERFRLEMTTIRTQIESSITAVQDRFAQITDSVDKMSSSLEEILSPQNTGLRLVTDIHDEFPVAYSKSDDAPSSDDGTSFFRTAAER